MNEEELKENNIDEEDETRRFEEIRHRYFDSALELIMDREIFFIFNGYKNPAIQINSFVLNDGYTVERENGTKFLNFPVIREGIIDKRDLTGRVRIFHPDDEEVVCGFPKKILHKLFSRIMCKSNLNILKDRICIFFDAGDLTYEVITTDEFTEITGIPDIEGFMNPKNKGIA